MLQKVKLQLILQQNEWKTIRLNILSNQIRIENKYHIEIGCIEFNTIILRVYRFKYCTFLLRNRVWNTYQTWLFLPKNVVLFSRILLVLYWNEIANNEVIVMVH